MWSLIAARLSPSVLAGLAGVVVLGLVLGFTYRKGYQASDQKWQLKWERQQGAFMQAQVERTNKALQAMADRHQKQAQVGKKISEIVIPDTESCSDTEWMLAHNRAVQAANGS